MVSYVKLDEKIMNCSRKSEFADVVIKLQVLSYNKRADKEVLSVVDKAIEKGKMLKDETSLIKLYSLKITHIQHLKENFIEVRKLAERILKLSTKNNFSDGIALYYAHIWYIKKFEGNKKEANSAIKKSWEILNKSGFQDDFIYYICSYLYAIEIWLEYRNPDSADILENCVNYFYLESYFHGLAMSLGVLTIIYQQTQNKEKSMQLIKRILSNGVLLQRVPEEIKSIIHYFLGVGHKLSLNINKAESHLYESQSILKPLYKKSIYSGYYLRCLAHLTACYALQGKLEQAMQQMKEVEDLIEEGIATRNIDSFSKNQTQHDFNLTMFYIYSRLQSFHIEDLQELVQNIIKNIKKQHSDAIFFSEFLLHASLTKEQLTEIKHLNNPSTKRVEHIINFLIEKTTYSDEKQIMNYTSALKRRPVEEQMTFTEKAFADLLAAQEYYKINRFAEIYPLLKKFENQLYKIEVLEMRVFMEAFIQVGAYKNGDPLGPALQYIAIKKCRQYGFSRLENKLSDYLAMQGNDTIRAMV